MTMITSATVLFGSTTTVTVTTATIYHHPFTPLGLRAVCANSNGQSNICSEWHN